MRVPRIDHRVQANGSIRQVQDHGDLSIIALSRHYRTLSNLNGEGEYYTPRGGADQGSGVGACNVGGGMAESKEGREKRTYKDPNPIFGALRMS